jgi:phenylalanyl-tRNA synthetase alpha chain
MVDARHYPELAELLDSLPSIEAQDEAGLEALRIALLGRKQGKLTEYFRRVPTKAAEERRDYGAALNEVKAALEAAFDRRQAALRATPVRATLDLSMPGRRRWIGADHPLSQVATEIGEIFRALGFTIAVGPEAEDEWLNFFALNFPADHPALDLHDTMYLEGGTTEGGQGGRFLLRTHTSPVQIRVMREGPPPYRVVVPGMVYRNDPFDASHAPAFAQIEGLAVDEGIGMVDLKATLVEFARRFFSATVKIRLRPSYFPFTEPSGELDVECQVCRGAGCPACKRTGWMEILGCGMVHPSVLRNGGVDPDRYSGWAFGMGLARAAMNRYGLPDIRLLYGGDMRLLRRLAGESR